MNTIHQLTPTPNSVKSDNTVQLKIPAKNVGEIVNLLIEQSIPFDLQYLQPVLSEWSSNNDETQLSSTLVEKSSKYLPQVDGEKISIHKYISNIFDKYITNGLTSIPPKQEEIAEELNISVSTFKAHFRLLYGKSFYQVYMDKRMEYAAKLLKKGYKCNEVTVMVGYSENAAIKFNKMFQKHFGISPKKYQMEHYGKIDRRTRRTKSQL